MYYLKDHARVVYNDGDWPTTLEDEEANKEEGKDTSNHLAAARNASTVGRALPLGLLSVKMKEYSEKGKLGGGESENGHTSKEGQLASPGMPSASFPRGLLTIVAEQPKPAAKADIPQGPFSTLKYNKVLAESNVKPRARKPLAAANTSVNARKKSKAAPKPSRHRVQVVLTHTKEDKENVSRISSDSDDEIDDPLHTRPAQGNLSKVKEQEQAYKQLLNDIVNLPDPFLLTSEDESDDPSEGATSGEPERVEGITATNSDPAPITTADPAGVRDAKTLKSCLHTANAPPKGLTVSFKDPLLKFHFYHYPDPNDIWSQCGLPLRLNRKSSLSFLLTLDHSHASYSQTLGISYWTKRGLSLLGQWSLLSWQLEHSQHYSQSIVIYAIIFSSLYFLGYLVSCTCHRTGVRTSITVF